MSIEDIPQKRKGHHSPAKHLARFPTNSNMRAWLKSVQKGKEQIDARIDEAGEIQPPDTTH